MRKITDISDEGGIVSTSYYGSIAHIIYDYAPHDTAEKYSSDVTVITDNETAEAKSDILDVAADGEFITVSDKNGNVLSKIGTLSLEEYNVTKTVGGEIKASRSADGPRTTIDGGIEEFSRVSNHGTVTFKFTQDENIYGLGNHEEGYDNIKGHFIHMFQESMKIVVPVFISSKGYAVLIDCSSYMNFDSTDYRHGKFYLDSVDRIDLWFVYGGNYDEVYKGLRRLTGATPMLPKWSVGYIQSKERYTTQDELIEIGRKYRELGIPIDCIVQDWLYWDDGCWGNKHFNQNRYPDFDKVTEYFHENDLRLMISIWPNLSGDCADKKELSAAGFMLSDGNVYNAFDEKAREMYWKQAYEGLFIHGIDGWWCDAAEPAEYDTNWRGKNRLGGETRCRNTVAEFKKHIDDSILNVYSLYHSKGIYENQRKCTDMRVMNLTRSGFAGQHRYGTVVWSSDISANWETLTKQVKVIQNYVATGEAYWNSDIGAFFACGGYEWFRDGDYPDGCNDEGYRELYTRWLQFAGFTPLMRSHGTNTPREVWRFGERGTKYRDAIEKAIGLRYKLAPYMYSLNAAVTYSGSMPIIPLGLAFPEDEDAVRASGEYMYGHEFLVVPVTRPTGDNDSVTVYLPEGKWYDFYTEQPYEGGQYIRYRITIDNIPLFVKAGSIVPVCGNIRSTADLDGMDYTLNVYSGCDGEFTVYDDDGLDYAYENGDYTSDKISYCDATGAVTHEITGNEKYKHNYCVRIVK